MQQIREQTTGSDYGTATTIENVWNSPGGYYNVQGGAAFMELQYVPPGQGLGGDNWTNEVLVPVGTGNLTNGTTGVRFRDAGSSSGPAIVTAALSAEAEPLIVVGAPGSLVLASTGVIAGIVPASGSGSGSGFSYTHVNSSGIYVFTFTNPLSSAPAVVATLAAANPSLAPIVSAVSVNGFQIDWEQDGGTHSDTAFSFIAQPA